MKKRSIVGHQSRQMTLWFFVKYPPSPNVMHYSFSYQLSLSYPDPRALAIPRSITITAIHVFLANFGMCAQKKSRIATDFYETLILPVHARTCEKSRLQSPLPTELGLDGYGAVSLSLILRIGTKIPRQTRYNPHERSSVRTATRVILACTLTHACLRSRGTRASVQRWARERRAAPRAR